MQVDGHRADIVILKSALAQAAYEGRERIGETDILLAAELALPHRLHRTPFDEGESQMEDLEQRLERARVQVTEGQALSTKPEAGAGKKKDLR